MARPTQLATWDTNRTHVSTVTSGHRTDGYGTDEIPASDEFNDHLNFIGQWVSYLDAAQNAPVTMLIPATEAVNPGAAWTFSTSLRWVLGAATGTDTLVFGLELPVGATLTGYSVKAHKLSNATKSIATRVFDVATAAGTVIGASVGTSNATNAPGFVGVGETGLAIAAASGHNYVVEINISTGATTDEVLGLEITYTPPQLP